MLGAETRVTRVARLFGYSHVTVPNLIRQNNKKGNNLDAQRSDRLNTTTQGEDI